MIDQTLRDADSKMDKAVEVAKEDFAAIRTGRAHPAMFAKITADYYGTPTPIQQLAGSRSPSRARSSSAPTTRGARPAIEKAIRDSDLGVNPTDDGKVLRVTLPELTEDRRKEYIKLAQAKAEEARVVRPQHPPRTPSRRWTGPRRTARSARTSVGAEKRLDGLTKKHVDAVDDLLKHKEAELLEV